MHGLTSQLAALRLAPVQAAMWGHPETSGLPTMDYFVSGEALEPDGAQAFYSERLLMLPGLGCHYGRQAPPVPPGAGPDLPANGPLFVCPGTTFKYMPEHDGVPAEIARRLGGGTFVYFSQQPRWTALLKERLRAAFAARGLDAEAHVVFAPWMPKAGFHALLRRADVFLDTIGFSGFNTVMQAVECGLPVVTRRGRFLRGRLGSAILSRMGIEELVAATDEDYVRLAVRLAGDAEYRQRLRDAIAARREVLFDDLAPIRALEQWLLGLCRPPAGQAAAPPAAARAATIASTDPAHDRRHLP
jgi:predicted O-linked N-acetylglucosamine transferase (SPINDLY family)